MRFGIFDSFANRNRCSPCCVAIQISPRLQQRWLDDEEEDEELLRDDDLVGIDLGKGTVDDLDKFLDAIGEGEPRRPTDPALAKILQSLTEKTTGQSLQETKDAIIDELSDYGQQLDIQEDAQIENLRKKLRVLDEQVKR